MVNFYSVQFITFLLIALVCYYTFLKKQQWICLLAASAVFYYWTGIENFAFLLLTGMTTWAGAKILAKYSEELLALRKDKTLEKEVKAAKKEQLIKKRRFIMWSVLGVNFGVLAILKYLEPVLDGLGFSELGDALGLVLPLGISFYTFQSIGYLLDIYFEKHEPEQNFAKYMLFVSYFPQMIQGPINRYDTMGEQFAGEYTWDGKRATKAVYRIGYGLLKKYTIANTFSVILVNIFDTPVRDYSGAMVLFGILLYSAQQYADFSGGIDMVLGISELFGIQMTENFRQPYFSTSLAEFWRRWHISLGKWMRDYVFYPFALTKPLKNLGKWANKKLGKHLGRTLPAALGNLLVFFIVGIWHGAESHYIVWGLYNGAIIAMSDLLAPVYEKTRAYLHVKEESKLFYLFRMIRTFIIVNIGWYFDRIYDIEMAFYSLKKTVMSFQLHLFSTEYAEVFEGVKAHGGKIAVLGCILVFIVSVLEERKIDMRERLYKCPLVIRWCIYSFVIIVILFGCTRVGETGGFMYANF